MTPAPPAMPDAEAERTRRPVPNPRSLAEELKPRVQGRGDEELLFTAPQGGPLRARTFRQPFFTPAVVKAGPGHLKVTPHKLRHTAASPAIASGADVNGHLFRDRLDEVSKKMHKRHAKQSAEAKAKLEKAERKARKATESATALEDDAA
ncbi:hypothetical protein A6P39_024215 [Streptomyces sp. FXJ1.172]|uniref:hypothetical protein n=1 Tax=Streptomyces sp. FXJ1.172 TaxID=710705 RepID=UPI000B222811|nr:hypothetical protein [Streptomyces sp. FXJ1.172]WEO96883.1 hypothetical protein A6P39_024215 [Streptomyces sp. FXJ1.172]